MLKALIVVVTVFLSGCLSGLPSNLQLVEDNVFYSTRHPESKIIIHRDYEYIGKVENRRTSDNGNDIKNTRYLFVNYDKNRKINSGVEILIKEILAGGGYWLSDIFGSNKNKVFSSVKEVNNDFYQQAVLIDRPGNVSFYTEKGFISPNRGIAWGIARNTDPDNKKQINVYYWEDFFSFSESVFNVPVVDSAGSWLNRDLYTQDQEAALSDFIKRGKSSFSVEGLTAEEMNNLKNSGSANVGISNSDVSSRLLKLKEAFDSGLINEDEYNVKRKELIELL